MNAANASTRPAGRMAGRLQTIVVIAVVAVVVGVLAWSASGAGVTDGVTVIELPAGAAYQANKDKGLAVVGVFISESAEDIAGYAGRAGLTFPITVDQQEAIAAAYRTMGVPTHFFIGPDGKVREVRIGALSKDDMARSIAAIMN